MPTSFAFLDFGAPEISISVVALAVFIFEVLMFINALKNTSISHNMRIFWCVAMLFIHPFIAIVYYFTDYQKTK